MPPASLSMFAVMSPGPMTAKRIASVRHTLARFTRPRFWIVSTASMLPREELGALQLRPRTRLPHARHHLAQLFREQHIDDVVDRDDALHAAGLVDHRNRQEIIARDGGGDFIPLHVEVNSDDVINHDLGYRALRLGGRPLAHRDHPEYMFLGAEDIDVIDQFGLFRCLPDVIESLRDG